VAKRSAASIRLLCRRVAPRVSHVAIEVRWLIPGQQIESQPHGARIKIAAKSTRHRGRPCALSARNPAKPRAFHRDQFVLADPCILVPERFQRMLERPCRRKGDGVWACGRQLFHNLRIGRDSITAQTRFHTDSPNPRQGFRTLYPAITSSFSAGIFAISSGPRFRCEVTASGGACLSQLFRETSTN
jgi:hypothetical protein